MDKTEETTSKNRKRRTFKGHIDMNMIYEYLAKHRYTAGLADSEKRSVRKRAKGFFVRGGKLYFVGEGESSDADKKPERIVPLSQDERWKIVAQEHVDHEGNHLGMEKTTKMITEKFYWVGISLNVREYVKRCVYCIARNATNNVLLDACKDYDFKITLNSSIPVDGGDNKGLISPENAIKQETLDDTGLSLIPMIPSASEFMDLAHHFWDKVEMQVLGPFGREKKYVVVLLDSYSLWPEVVVMETVSPATVTHYILSLICRYGEMKQLILTGSDDHKSKITYEDMLPRLDLLSKAGFKIAIERYRYPKTAEIWKDLVKAIKGFIKDHADTWTYCLEMCLLPYRISRPDQAEYTPAYLTFGREPLLPSSLSHRHGNQLDPHLTAEQVNESVSSLMEVFTGYQPDLPNKSTSGVTPVVLPIPPGKVKVTTFTVPAEDAAKYKSGQLSPPPGAKGIYISPGESDTKNSTQMVSLATRYGTRKRKMSRIRKEAQEEEITSHEVTLEWLAMEDEDPSPGKKLAEHNYALRSGTATSAGSEKVDVDTYYEALLMYMTKRSYPPGHSKQFKRCVRKMCEKFVVENGVLFYENGASLREVIMSRDKRISMLQEAHIEEAGTHVCKNVMKEKLAQYYWKGLALDCEAYVGRCKACRRRKPSSSAETADAQAPSIQSSTADKVRKPSSSSETADAQAHNIQSSTSDNIVPVDVTDESILGMINYLETGKFSSDCDQKQQATIKRLSSKFCLYGEILYLNFWGEAENRRQVLISDQDKKHAVDDAHVKKTGQHVDVEATRKKLQAKYFWLSMGKDVKDFIENCTVCKQQTTEASSTISSHDLQSETQGDLASSSKDNSSKEDVSRKDSPLEEQELDKDISDVEGDVVVYLEDDPVAEAHNSSEGTGETTPATCVNEVGETNLRMEVQEVNVINYPGMTLPKDKTPDTASTTLQILDAVTVSGTAQEKTNESNFPLMESGQGTGDYHQGSLAVPSVSVAERDSGIISILPVNNTDQIVPLHIPDGEVRDSWVKSIASDAATTAAVQSILQEDVNQSTREINVIIPQAKEENLLTSNQQNDAGLKKSPDSSPAAPSPPKLSRGAAICSVCGQKVSGALKYKIHMYKHTGIKPFPCEVCGKRFTHGKSLRLHKRKHTGNLPYLCSICGKGYPRSGSLAAHLKIHAKGGGVTVTCDICDRKFASANRLARHKEFKHPPTPKTYSCAECHKDFTTARSLKRHVQSYHLKVKHHVCQYCGKGFYRKEYLTSHLTQHTGEPSARPRRSHNPPKPTRLRPPPPQTQPVPPVPQAYTVTVTEMDTGMVNTQVVTSADEHQMPNIYYGYATGHPEHDPRVMQVSQGPSGFVFGQPAVQYEVECGTGSEQYDAEALSAINMLAQASVNQGY